MTALQALKGIGSVVAATIIAEVGDFARFAHPRQLVAYFGLAPGEHSGSSAVRPRGTPRPRARSRGPYSAKLRGTIARPRRLGSG
jgi:transposase